MVAVRTAANTGEGLAILGKFMAAYSNAVLVQLNPGPEASEVFFALRIVLNPEPPQSASMELALGIAFQVLRLLLGRDYRALSVHLPHRPLSSPDRYREVLL